MTKTELAILGASVLASAGAGVLARKFGAIEGAGNRETALQAGRAANNAEQRVQQTEKDIKHLTNGGLTKQVKAESKKAGVVSTMIATVVSTIGAPLILAQMPGAQPLIIAACKAMGILP